MADIVWGRATYHAFLQKSSIELRHVMAALTERREVQAVFSAFGGVEPLAPFLIAQGRPLTRAMHRATCKLLNESRILQKVMERGDTDQGKLRADLLRAIEARVNGAIGQESRSQNLYFEKPVDYDDLLVDFRHQIVGNPGREPSPRIVANYLTGLERRLNQTPPPVPKPFSVVDCNYDALPAALAHLWHITSNQDESPVYALGLLQAVVESDDQAFANDACLNFLRRQKFTGRASLRAVNAIIQEELNEEKKGGSMQRTDTLAPPATYRPKIFKEGSMLGQFRNLTALGFRDKLEPYVGDSKDLRKIVNILARRSKNNPLLIGETGTGKTARVEELARMIAHDEIPALAGRTIVEIDMATLVAGSNLRGQFEEKLKQVIKEASESVDDEGRNDIILFIDETHTLLGAGDSIGGLDASNILKPALARGDISVIGATTPLEARRFDRDPALARRFQKVDVPVPSDVEVKQILRVIKPELEEFHGVRASESVTDLCVDHSTRYLRDNGNQPDLAKTLLDTVLASVKLDEASPVDAEGYKTATINDVAVQIYEQTGVPVHDLTDDDPAAPHKLLASLQEEIVGQDRVLTALANAVGTKRSGHADPNKPFFIYIGGKTGTGKTETAQQLADRLHLNYERLDMSEFMDREAVGKFIGASPGYVGYEAGGRLTNAVRRHPYSLILLDELEKAHTDVLQSLLGVLDAGRMTDNKGRTVDFSNCFFIGTSNLNLGIVKQQLGFRTATAPASATDAVEVRKYDTKLMDAIIKASGNKFSPEFVNRMDEILETEDMTAAKVSVIIERTIDKLRQRQGMAKLEIHLQDAVVPHLVELGGSDLKYGARPYKRLVNREVARDLSKAFYAREYDPKVETVVDVGVTPDKSRLTFLFETAAARRAAAGPSGTFNFKAGLFRPAPESNIVRLPTLAEQKLDLAV